MLAALITVVTSLQSILDDFMQAETERNRNSERVLDFYSLIRAQDAAIAGALGGVIGLSIIAIVCGCRQRRQTLKQADEAREEAASEARRRTIAETDDLP
jgi:hypothetical protein